MCTYIRLIWCHKSWKTNKIKYTARQRRPEVWWLSHPCHLFLSPVQSHGRWLPGLVAQPAFACVQLPVWQRWPVSAHLQSQHAQTLTTVWLFLKPAWPINKSFKLLEKFAFHCILTYNINLQLISIDYQ